VKTKGLKDVGDTLVSLKMKNFMFLEDMVQIIIIQMAIISMIFIVMISIRENGKLYLN